MPENKCQKINTYFYYLFPCFIHFLYIAQFDLAQSGEKEMWGKSCKSMYVLNIMVVLYLWQRIKNILLKSREYQFIVPIMVNFKTYSRNYLAFAL